MLKSPQPDQERITKQNLMSGHLVKFWKVRRHKNISAFFHISNACMKNHLQQKMKDVIKYEFEIIL